MSKITYITVPGYTGSGPNHWQSRWEQSYDNFHRVEQTDWENPDMSEWVNEVDNLVGQHSSPIILIGHSLGCNTIIHWIAHSFQKSVKAAFLVAPADPQNPNFPQPARGFKNLPKGPLPIPSTLVASNDDPYLDPARARFLAISLGSTLKMLEGQGHLNSDSKLGMWPTGKGFLDELSIIITGRLV